MLLDDTALLITIIFLQFAIVIFLLFAMRKSQWASRFALATKREIDKSSISTTRQIEELAKIYRKTGLIWGDLPPTRGWAASPDFLNVVYDIVLQRRPSRIVELGSGVSTIILASAAKKTGNTGITTIDHDDKFLSSTHADLQNLNLDKYVNVKLAPLVYFDIDGKKHLWYDFDPKCIGESIDMIIVDGPPEPIVGAGGRLPVIYYLFPYLSENGCVIFDDAARSGEKDIFQMISKSFPEMSFTRHHTEKGVVVVSQPG